MKLEFSIISSCQFFCLVWFCFLYGISTDNGQIQLLNNFFLSSYWAAVDVNARANGITLLQSHFSVATLKPEKRKKRAAYLCSR